MDNLEFLASKSLIQEVVTSLEKTAENVLRWGLFNAVTYDMAKTEAISFSKACNKKVKKEIAAIRLRVRE